MRRLAAALVVAGLCGACGGTIPESEAPITATSEAASSSPGGAAAAVAEDPPISGGKPRQRAELRQILAGLGETGIRRVGVQPPGRWKPYAPGDVKLVVTLGDRHDLRATWKAYLLAGAFYDRLLELGGPRLIAIEIAGQGGSRLAGLKPADDQPSGVPAEPRDPAELATAVRDAAVEARASVESFETLTPVGTALAVTLRVDDPAAFLKHRELPLLEALADRWSELDGLYLELLDRDGRRSSVGANASRARTGLGWLRPDLAGCDPMPGSRPPGYEPPPCPA